MIRLADAEAEQELWYSNTVRGNEDEAEDYGSLAADYDSDTDSESDEEEDDEYESDEEEDNVMDFHYTRPRFSHTPVIGVQELASVDEEDEEEDEEENTTTHYDMDIDEDDSGMYELTRTTSHRPPSLCSDCSDDELDDDAHPPSPPQPKHNQLVLTGKHHMQTGYFDDAAVLENDDQHHVGPLFEDALAMISSY